MYRSVNPEHICPLRAGTSSEPRCAETGQKMEVYSSWYWVEYPHGGIDRSRSEVLFGCCPEHRHKVPLVEIALKIEDLREVIVPLAAAI